MNSWSVAWDDKGIDLGASSNKDGVIDHWNRRIPKNDRIRHVPKSPVHPVIPMHAEFDQTRGSGNRAAATRF